MEFKEQTAAEYSFQIAKGVNTTQEDWNREVKSLEAQLENAKLLKNEQSIAELQEEIALAQAEALKA